MDGIGWGHLILARPQGQSRRGAAALGNHPMNTPSTQLPHDDGLECLRDVRPKLVTEAGGDLKQLGNRYRKTEAKHPEKVVDPKQLLTRALRQLK
jgi:hypothetical protein